MTLQLKARLPYLELILVVVVAVLGWATYRLYQDEQQAGREREDLQRKFEAAFKKQEESWQQHDEDWRRYVLNMQDVFKMQDVLKMQDALKLQDAYLDVAAHFQTGMTELQTALTNALSAQGASKVEPFKRKSQNLKAWLQKQQERAETERFQVKSRELKQRIADTEFFSPAGPVSITKEFETLLGEIVAAFDNYLSDANYILDTAGQPLTGDAVQKRWRKLTGEIDELRELATQAQVNGKAVQAFVEARQPLEFAKAPQRELETVPSVAGGSADASHSLRRVMYLLVAALGGLCILAAVVIYRQVVVAPLHLKLDESKALAAQQSTFEHFSRLAKELAHEIRNPLTAVNARLYTLQRALPEGTPESKDARVIQNEIKRLNRIVEEFLKLGSPADPKLATVSPESALREVQDLLGPELVKHDVRLEMGTVVDAPFRADPQLIKQVLINLVQNAAEAIGQEGVISLRARRDKFPLQGQSTDVVVLEVEDSGPGIPEELQARLFDPFFSTKDEGTGLGLPIAARIIDKHGGSLEFDSEFGRGTTFRVILPAIPIE